MLNMSILNITSYFSSFWDKVLNKTTKLKEKKPQILRTLKWTYLEFNAPQNLIYITIIKK